MNLHSAQPCSTLFAQLVSTTGALVFAKGPLQQAGLALRYLCGCLICYCF